jgi:spore coat protein H
VVALEIAPGDLAALDADPGSDRMFPARLTLHRKTVPALVRYRGASARTWPQKSFRIDVDDGFDLQGRDRFALVAEYPDAGKLTERFALDLLRALGVDAPRARYVSLTVNGVPNGVYLDVERVVGEYLVFHGLERDASIYRCGGRNCEMKLPATGPYQSGFTKNTNETLPDDDLDDLLWIVNHTDDDDFVRLVSERIDLDAYLANLAVDALVSNFLVEDSRSYWIHELEADRWRYAPWDLNNALSSFDRGWPADRAPRGTDRDARVFTVYDPTLDKIYRQRLLERAGQKPTWSVLATRLWDVPETRARIVDAIAAALAGPFTVEKAGAHLRAIWAVAGEAILADPFVLAEQAARAPAFLEEFVRARRAWLEARLGALRAHGSGPLVVNEIGFADPITGAPGYVELFNRGGVGVDLGGLAITDDLRVPDRHLLPAGLLVPPRGHLVLVADGTAEVGHVPFVPSPEHGEIGVFRAGAVHDPLDAVYYGRRARGRAYGRWPDGAESFREMTRSPGAAAR